ncbi:dihydroceramidase [Acrasis kona]|uniref:Dihydroceramidase n=1 Tax=Acrasis kona TaxID=1008807 RepID=A0AAW2YZI6_9EUKA
MKLNSELNRDGFWQVTSTIDWCEPNYTHSSYIAETWNTFSNLVYIALSIYFMYQSTRLYQSDPQLKTRTMMRTFVSASAIIIVGIGSFLFHMTLLKEYQALDELAMNLMAVVNIFCQLNNEDEIEADKYPRLAFLKFRGIFSSPKAGLSAIGCGALFALSLVIYGKLSDVVFETMFGLSLLVSLVLTYKNSVKSYPVPQQYKVQQAIIRRNRLKLLGLVVFTSVFSFLVWSVDNVTCPRFEAIKLHSFWHLGTALGTYFWMILSTYVYLTGVWERNVAELNNIKAPLVELKWFPLPHLPTISSDSRKQQSILCKVNVHTVRPVIETPTSVFYRV